MAWTLLAAGLCFLIPEGKAKLGLVDIAVRTMEVYTTATLEATLTPGNEPTVEWRAVMDDLSEVARASYRRVVYENPDFVNEALLTFLANHA